MKDGKEKVKKLKSLEKRWGIKIYRIDNKNFKIAWPSGHVQTYPKREVYTWAKGESQRPYMEEVKTLTNKINRHKTKQILHIDPESDKIPNKNELICEEDPWSWD
jgi:hypothetical protein